jgi:hypothetical protein
MTRWKGRSSSSEYDSKDHLKIRGRHPRSSTRTPVGKFNFDHFPLVHRLKTDNLNLTDVAVSFYVTNTNPTHRNDERVVWLWYRIQFLWKHFITDPAKYRRHMWKHFITDTAKYRRHNKTEGRGDKRRALHPQTKSTFEHVPPTAVGQSTGTLVGEDTV